LNDTSTPDALSKALHSYRTNQKQWAFLGYSEEIAVAVLVDFFSMERVRNPSQKPLNVLSMVGKSRVKAIADAIKQRQQPAPTPDDETTDEMTEG
jgi:ERCC4-type nuclease